jgi:hypothetical protein
MIAAAMGTALYLVVAVILGRRFQESFPPENNGTWIVLYWFMVLAAGAYPLFSAVRIGWQKRHIPKTKLLHHEQERQDED